MEENTRMVSYQIEAPPRTRIESAHQITRIAFRRENHTSNITPWNTQQDDEEPNRRKPPINKVPELRTLGSCRSERSASNRPLRAQATCPSRSDTGGTAPNTTKDMMREPHRLSQLAEARTVRKRRSRKVASGDGASSREDTAAEAKRRCLEGCTLSAAPPSKSGQTT